MPKSAYINIHLKIYLFKNQVWPADKVESMDCASLECFEKVKNSGENLEEFPLPLMISTYF